MKRIKYVLFAVFAFLVISPNTLSAQQEVVTVQPAIIVIPFVKEGEDIRTVLEGDFNKRMATTKVKEAFDNRGFTTIDFIGRLKAAKDNQAFTSGNKTDLKAQIIQMSGADIYVELEFIANKGQSGTSVILNLTARDVSTGASLANKVGDSGKFFTDDIIKLTQKAIEKVVEDFLNVMQMKFTEIVNNGKSILVDISFDEDSDYTMSDELGTSGLPLSDLIEVWMEENAYKNNYHIQGTTDYTMLFSDVRIPLKEPSGKNYNPNKFALKLYQFLKSLSLDVKKDQKGNTIYMTIK